MIQTAFVDMENMLELLTEENEVENELSVCNVGPIIISAY